MRKNTSLRVNLAPWQVTRWFVGAVLVLFTAHCGAMFFKFGLGYSYVRGLVPFFDFDREHNLPTIYSCFALLACASLLALTAFAERQAGKPDFRYWGWLAVLFLFLAADEGFIFHEKWSAALRAAFGTYGFFRYAWIIPYGAFLLFLGIAYCRFLFRQPPRSRNLILLAGGLFSVGALGMESVAGYYFDRFRVEDLGYCLLATTEELLEMIGIVIFIHALLTHLADAGLQLRFGVSPAAMPAVDAGTDADQTGQNPLDPNLS